MQRDISQQKELDRLKDEFVSNVSHELRTPIANVKLYISLLTRGKPEKYDDYLQTLRREAARLEKLIEDLLDLSRLDLDKTPVDAGTHRRGPAGGAAHHRSDGVGRQPSDLLIDYRTDVSLPLAQADPAMLGQVISNLLTNAINYTPAGGAITVTTAQQRRADQNWITITVQDTGPGIAKKDLPHLFERFYRGEAGRKSGAPGTGLGLAISAQIMNKLGGLITARHCAGRRRVFHVVVEACLKGSHDSHRLHRRQIGRRQNHAHRETGARTETARLSRGHHQARRAPIRHRSSRQRFVPAFSRRGRLDHHRFTGQVSAGSPSRSGTHPRRDRRARSRASISS